MSRTFGQTLEFVVSLFPPVTLCISSFPLQLVPLFPTWFCFYFHDIYAYMLLHIHIKSRSPKIRENIRYLYSEITLNYLLYLQLHQFLKTLYFSSV